MPVRNMGEGSEAERLPLLGSYELTAGKDRQLTSTADRASHGSLSLPGLKAGVSLGESDERDHRNLHPCRQPAVIH